MKRLKFRDWWLKLLPSPTVLFWLCAVLFGVEFGWVLLAFFGAEQVLREFWASGLLYLVCLLLYLLRKSINQMNRTVGKQRRGHLFVFAWIVFVGVLLVISKASGGKYLVPWRAFEDLSFVVSVFLGPKIRKIIRYVKNNQKRPLLPYLIGQCFGARAARLYCRAHLKIRRRGIRSRRLITETKGIRHGTARA